MAVWRCGGVAVWRCGGVAVVVVCVVRMTEDTASLSWRVPRCTELNAAES